MEISKKHSFERQNMSLIQKNEETLKEKFDSGEKLNESQLKEVLDNQIKKIGVARKSNYAHISVIENTALKNDLKQSLYQWENKEVKGKIQTGEPIQNLTLYLPNSLKNGHFKTYLEPDMQQYLIDEKQKIISENERQEESILGKKKRKSVDNNMADGKEIRRKKQNIEEKGKSQSKKINIFFKKILNFLEDLLKDFLKLCTNKYSREENKKSETMNKDKDDFKIIQGETIKNNNIEVDINGEKMILDVSNIPEVHGKPEKKLKNLEEKLIIVKDERYLIKNGKIYNWNSSMKYLHSGIKNIYKYSDIKEIDKYLYMRGKKPLEQFNAQSYNKNIKICFGLIFLGEAKNSDIKGVKKEKLKIINEIFQYLKLPIKEITKEMNKQELNNNIEQYKEILFSYLREGNYTF